MSKFYGQVFGDRTTISTHVHTQGTNEIKVSAQSYDGSIIAKLYYNDNKDLCVKLETNHYSASCGETLFNDTFKDFNRLFEEDEIAYDNLVKLFDYYTISIPDKLIQLMSVRCAQEGYNIIDYIELAQELQSTDDIPHSLFEFGLIDKEELEEMRK